MAQWGLLLHVKKILCMCVCVCVCVKSEVMMMVMTTIIFDNCRR